MQTLLFDEEVAVPKAVNVASVPQLSPFRYPGGKTWFIPRLREWLHSLPLKPRRLIEPFAGGGIVSLTAVAENLVEAAHMVELDSEIAAVWETLIGGEGSWLASRIMNFEMTKENAIEALSANQESTRERAFKTIIKNRTFHGGILAAGSGFLKKGESGRGILSRWYPSTLAKRIARIELIRRRLSFECRDGFEVLEENKTDVESVFFIDPPYTAGGKRAGSRLYTHHQLDHELLFSKCAELEGDFVMTYDNAREVRDLASKYEFEAKPIPMKNTHHAAMTELVIGKNLSWIQGVERMDN
ncbi:MAG: DNA adenine methylase [Verrucomicrobiota bacterium]